MKLKLKSRKAICLEKQKAYSPHSDALIRWFLELSICLQDVTVHMLVCHFSGHFSQMWQIVYIYIHI